MTGAIGSSSTSSGAPSSGGRASAFGRYELLELLAVGGMAEIFLARGHIGGIWRPCVIKRILPEYSTSRQFVSMFIDEARITIGLDHEHIVRLLDFGQVDGAYFMAIDYVDGVDLVDVLRAVKARDEGIAPIAAAWIARGMARGLAAAHNAVDPRGRPLGIVHRDVSPQNVFLSWDGALKIGDFGIASARNKLTRTMPGSVKGKFGYMSPEQAQGGDVDQRTDVWATAVVLWEMLAGGRLFATDNPIETITRVIEMPVPLPSETRSGVPRELDGIVMRALSRSMSLRTSTATALADELDGFVAGRFGPADLASMLRSLELTPETARMPRMRGSRASMSVSIPRTRTAPPADVTLRALHDALRLEQNLWILVDIGMRHAELGQREQALAAIRTAACVFAHRGLVVQAICAIHAARPLVDDAAFRVELGRLARLRGHERGALDNAIAEIAPGEFWNLAREADPMGLGGEQTDNTLSREPAPLLGAASVEEFVRLASLARVEKRARGAILVREGDVGDALFAIGRGRLLVHTQPSQDDTTPARAITLHDGAAPNERVYLGALGEGDFFGEFSFLTRSPRSATVEASSDVVVLRLDRIAVDQLLVADTAFRDRLVDFYKERVAELVLAKNPILALLPTEARRALVRAGSLHKHRDGETVVVEGDASDDVFVVIGGEVEVLRDEDGFPVFINKLREGQFFGEMAALKGHPRTATVKAMGDVELLRIPRFDVERVLNAADDVRNLLHRAIDARAQESDARVAETTRIFSGV